MCASLEHWRECRDNDEPDLPVAVSQDTVKVGEFTLRVYQLGAGRRVIPAAHTARLLEAIQ